MEKILLFQVETKAAEEIKKLASPLGIKVLSVSAELYGESLGKIAENRARAQAGSKNSIILPQSLMLFCGVTEKHLDKMLALLKREQIAVDYKAVLTPTNQNWTIQKLYLEMIKERAAITKKI